MFPRKSNYSFRQYVYFCTKCDQNKTRRMCIYFHKWVNSHLMLSELSTCLFFGFSKKLSWIPNAVFPEMCNCSVTMWFHRTDKEMLYEFHAIPMTDKTHINTNYTDRLSLLKHPGSKLQLSLTEQIGVFGVFVYICVCLWSYICDMHTCCNLLLINLYSKWGENYSQCFLSPSILEP